MKILNLRFKNLNSLKGEWEIDFTAPEYINDGIFAITGPTGSGKTTVLDGICLALYGRTPRLKSISKSTNEIMSRQTGECFSEITFETAAGCYKANWSQHRARKNPGGNLSDARHEISDAVSGKVLESKKTLTAQIIEKKTGMDFDRFVRSVMLAQGGFSAFLIAASDERAPVLEQITGTEIYSIISIQVHNSLREEREKLNILEAESSSFSPLTSDAKSIILVELDSKKKEEEDLLLKIDKVELNINALKAIVSLEEDLILLGQKQEDLTVKLGEFIPFRVNLEKAMEANELEVPFTSLSALRELQKQELSLLEEIKIKLPELEEILADKNNSLKDSLAMSVILKDQQEELFRDIKKVRSLDIQVSEKKLHQEDLISDISNLKAVLKDNELSKNELISKREIILEDKKLTEAYLNDNSMDEALVSGLSGIKERLGFLDDYLGDIESVKEDLKKAEISLVAITDKINELDGAYYNLKKELEESISVGGVIKKELDELLGGRLLREYRAEYESVLREQAFMQKILNLENEREKLQKNEPCPLCGSMDHPYKNNSPSMDGDRKRIDENLFILEKANDLETKYKESEIITREIESKITETSHLITIWQNSGDTGQKEIERMKSELNILISKQRGIESILANELESYSLHLPGKLEDILPLLQEKYDEWNIFSRKNESDKEDLNKLDNDLKSCSFFIDDSLARMQNKETDLSFLSADLDVLTSQRHDLFGNKDPDIEENKIREKIIIVEEKIDVFREEENNAKQALRDLEMNINKFSSSTSDRKLELESEEEDFLYALTSAGFETESIFREHCLPKTERDIIREKAKELDDIHLALEATKADINKKLTRERSRINPDNSLRDIKQLETTYKDLSEQLKAIVELIAVQRHKLEEDARIQEEKEGSIKALEKQRIDSSRWEALHGLIGSADGKKYRNFAQGLTFEMLINQANMQLAKMTDRYQLIRDPELALELNVIDTWQAGEIRSTSNLSGGESFIVSLALALGLSRMAGRKVRVDSLFLDEGFGTLDDEALETALDTLAGLHQEGKLIGVISHIPALKERIGTQISVNPVSGGRSVIEGPGCRKVSKQ